MKVALDTFARSGIEAHLGHDLAAGVRTALRDYTQRLRPGRKVPEFPRFLRESPFTSLAGDLELSVDPNVEQALEREARESQGVSVEQLAAHAVLAYLADADREASECSAQRPLARL